MIKCLIYLLKNFIIFFSGSTVINFLVVMTRQENTFGSSMMKIEHESYQSLRLQTLIGLLAENLSVTMDYTKNNFFGF